MHEKAPHEDRNLETHPQTRAKLDAWRRYLPAYLGKLGSLGDLYVLDLFAGSGRVRDGMDWADGSPLIAVRLAAEAQANLARQGRRTRIHLRFVELEEAPRATLDRLVDPFRAALDIAVLPGRASDNLPALMAESEQRPTIAFIDPDGFKGITFEEVAAFGARKYNEVLLNFDVQGLLRTAGIVQTRSVSTFCGGDWWHAYNRGGAFDEDGFLAEYGRRLAQAFNYVSAQRLDFPEVHANRAIVQGCYSVKGVDIWQRSIKAAMPKRSTIAFEFVPKIDRCERVNGVLARIGVLSGRPCHYGDVRRCLGVFGASEDDIHQALLFLRASSLASWSSTLHAESSPPPRFLISGIPSGLAWDEVERPREGVNASPSRVGARG